MGFTLAGSFGTILTDDLAAGTAVGGFTFNTGASAFTLTGGSFNMAGGAVDNALNTETIQTAMVMTGTFMTAINLAGGNMIISGALSAASTAQQVSNTSIGTVTYNGSVADTGISKLVTGGSGTMVLDFTNMATPTNLMMGLGGATTALQFGTSSLGGALVIKGAASGATSQTFASTSLQNGLGTLTLIPNGGSGITINLGALAATGGSTAMNIVAASGGATVLSGTSGTFGRVTYQDATGVGFATGDGTTITRLTTFTSLPTSGISSSVDYKTSGTVILASSAAATADTLTMDTSSGAGSLDLDAAVLSLSKGGILMTGANNFTIQNGQIGGNSAELIVHQMGTGLLTISAAIGSGNTALTKNGTGTLVLSGTNAAAGVTNILQGMLQYAKEVSLYNDTTASWTSTNILVSNGATLGLNVGGAGEFTSSDLTTLLGNIDGATGSGVKGLQNGSFLALDTTNATGGAFTYSNAILNSNTTAGGGLPIAIVGLTKLGSGTLILGGANTYTGATTVKGGNLQVTGSLAAGSATTVAGGAVLSGTGTIAGATTISSGGILLGGTGAAASGTLTVSGGATLQSGSIIELALAGLGAHSTLALTAGSTFAAGQQFTFLDLGAAPGIYDNIITGVSLTGNASSWTITNAGWSGTFSYDGAGNIDLNLAVAPEPSTFVLLGMGMVVSFLFRRRFCRSVRT